MTPDDEATGCGISKIWLTRPDDPFVDACDWHGNAYMEGSVYQQKYSRALIDSAFLAQMLHAAGDNLFLKLKAYLYYGLVRALGGKYWEGKP